ncbi:MAG TPA: winged helix-turn-helix transcriptional regulator [Solirubrobacterales bacterium]
MLDAGVRDGQLPQMVRDVGDADYATGHQFRAGGYALSLFSRALRRLVLRALADGPRRLAELRRDVGGPAQTTLRGNLDTLIEVGALEKCQNDGKAGAPGNALTPIGRELLAVTDAIEAWLRRAPEGPVRLESETGKAAVKALAGGWGSTMLRALAAQPFSLTELDNLISAFSYPALERRLAAMRLAGCVAPVQGNGGGTPYAVTEWLRQGMAPLLAAVRCERRHLARDTAPLTRIDVEAILLLIVPLAAFEPHADGVVELAVGGGEESDGRSAGIRLTVRDGLPIRTTSKLEPGPESWVRGSASAWLDALVDGDSDQLESSGDQALTLDFVDGLHRALFIS